MSDAGGRHPAGVPDLGLFLPELRRLPSPAVDVSAGDESPVVSYPVPVSATLLVFRTRDAVCQNSGACRVVSGAHGRHPPGVPDRDVSART